MYKFDSAKMWRCSGFLKRKTNSTEASRQRRYDGRFGDSRNAASDDEDAGPESPSGLDFLFDDEISEDSVSPAITALSNELVLTTIFKKLSISDLLSCRLVSKQWKEVAKIVLKSRREPAFINVSDKTNFDELLLCMLNCGKENFPFRGINAIINSTDFGKQPQRWSTLVLFRLFGDVFTHCRASVNLCGSRDYKVNLTTILSGALGSIEELEIEQLQEITVSDGHHLEALRVIKFIKHSFERVREEALRTLLNICPNLEEIRGIHYHTMRGVDGVERNNLVSHLIYCGCRDSYAPRDGEHWVAAPRKLSTLSIKCESHYDRDYQIEFSTVRAFLEASSDTLNCLEVKAKVTGGSASMSDWPVLSNLEQLVIATPNIFPHRQVSCVFPALQQVILDAAVTDLNLGSYLWSDTVLTVKRLELHCHVTRQGIHLLASIFPNVSSILMHFCRHEESKTSSKFSRKLWDIWELKEFEMLRKLKIIDLPVALMNTEEFSLDSFITSFPQFVLAKMRARPELLTAAYVEEMREGGCITELKGLEELLISFDLDGLQSFAFKREPFVSELMLQAGLYLMPSLRATAFYYDFTRSNAAVMERLLRPVAGLIDCQYFEGVSPKEA